MIRGAVIRLQRGVGREVGSCHELPMKGTNSWSWKSPRTTWLSQLRGSQLGAVCPPGEFGRGDILIVAALEDGATGIWLVEGNILQGTGHCKKCLAPQHYLVQNVPRTLVHGILAGESPASAQPWMASRGFITWTMKPGRSPWPHFYRVST